MKTPMFLAILFALTLVAGAWAQNHGENFVLSGSSIQILDGKGSFTTLFNNPGTAHGVVMDVDNKHIIYGEGTTNGWLRLDPTNNAVTTILTDANVFDYTTEITIDHMGDFIVGSSDINRNYGLYRISGLSISTLATTLKMGIPGSFTGGIVRDVDTGNFVLQTYGGSAGPHPMVSIAPDGVFTTIVANVSTVGGPRYQLAQDMRTGDFYVGSNDSTQGYLIKVTRKGASSVVATNPDRFAFNVLVADRASSHAPRLVNPYRSTLYYTDLKTYAVTTVLVNGASVSPRGITFYQGRNIQTVLTAPGKYDLNFSFPAYAGKTYAAAIGISGIRPGIPLPDGRNILLNLGPLAVASVANVLQPLFNPGPGQLDKNGEAKGSMDLTSLPPKMGIVAYLMVVVLDSSAPLGIAVIADPWVMPL